MYNKQWWSVSVVPFYQARRGVFKVTDKRTATDKRTNMQQQDGNTAAQPYTMTYPLEIVALLAQHCSGNTMMKAQRRRQQGGPSWWQMKGGPKL
jgi:hypothetical protein